MSNRALSPLRAVFGNGGILGGPSSAKDVSYSDGYDSAASLTDEEGKKAKRGFNFSFRHRSSARESDDEGFHRHTDDDVSLSRSSSGNGSGRNVILRNDEGAHHRVKSLWRLGRGRSSKAASATPSAQTPNIGDSEDEARNLYHGTPFVYSMQAHRTADQHQQQPQSNNKEKKKRNPISKRLRRQKDRPHDVDDPPSNSETSESEDESRPGLPSPPQKPKKKRGFFLGGRRFGNHDATLVVVRQEEDEKVRRAKLVTQKYNASCKNMLYDLPRPNRGENIPSLLPDMDDATTGSEEISGSAAPGNGTGTSVEEASDINSANKYNEPHTTSAAARAAEVSANSPYAAPVPGPLSVSQQENEQLVPSHARKRSPKRSKDFILPSPLPSDFRAKEPSYRREVSNRSMGSGSTDGVPGARKGISGRRHSNPDDEEDICDFLLHADTAQTTILNVSPVSAATAKISNRTKDARLKTGRAPSPIIESVGSADDAEEEGSNHDLKNNNDYTHDYPHDTDGDDSHNEDSFYADSNRGSSAVSNEATSHKPIATQDSERILKGKLSAFSPHQSSVRSGLTEHFVPRSTNPVNVEISKASLSPSSSPSPPPTFPADFGSARVAASKSSTHSPTAVKPRPSMMSAMQDFQTDRCYNNEGKTLQATLRRTASSPGSIFQQANGESVTSGAETSRESLGLRKCLSRSQRFRQIQAASLDNNGADELEQQNEIPTKTEFGQFSTEQLVATQIPPPVDAEKCWINKPVPENKLFSSDRTSSTFASSSTLSRTLPDKSRSENTLLADSTELHDYGPLKIAESSHYNDSSLSQEAHQLFNSSPASASSSSKSPPYMPTLIEKAESEIFSKYDSISSITFGPLDKASFKRRPPSMRVRDGLFLTAQRLHRAQYSEYDDAHFGTLVMEGPSPDGYETELDEDGEEPGWWTVRVSIVNKDMEESDAEFVTSEFYQMESLEDVQNIHAIVADFLEAGQFSRALYVLTDVLLPALTSDRSDDLDDADMPNAFNSSSLVNMTMRNIGTIQLWQERYEDAMNTFCDAINNNLQYDQNQVSPSQAGENTQEAEVDVFDQAASLVLLGQCFYALGNFDEANRVFLKTLSLVRSKSKDHATGDEPGCSKTDNSDHHFTAGKVLNNIGCGFCELGFYKSASRSFQRALLVYISASDSVPECPKGKGSFSTHSLAAMLNVLKGTPEIAEAVPLPFVLDAAVTFCNLAFVLVRRKKFHDAATSLMEALRLQKMIVDPHHSIVLSTLENLAFVYVRDRRPKKALRVYENMLQMELETFSDPSHYHETMSKVLGNMNYVYIKMNKFQSAFWCLQGVLAHQESYLNDDDGRLQETRMLLRDQGAQLADPYAKSIFKPPQAVVDNFTDSDATLDFHSSWSSKRG